MLQRPGPRRGAYRITSHVLFVAGDITGDGTQSIAVACAESRTLRIYRPGAGGKFSATTQAIAGGCGSVAIARLTADGRAAIITANADAGSITIYFPA